MNETAQIIRDLLLEAVETTQDDWPLDISQRMSSTGHCMRKSWYTVRGEQRARMESTAIWEMRDGDIHEADLKNWLRRAGYTIENEQLELKVELPAGGTVKGHIDGTISGPLVYEESLFEAKSMSFMRFVDVVRRGVKESSYDYFLQSQMYMLTGNWPQCIFVVKCKDSSATKRMLRSIDGSNPKIYVEVIPFDAEAAQEGLDRHIRLAEFVYNDEAPPREYDKKDWHCVWCQHREICWGSGNGDT